jgi:hypothetical protein
MSILPPQLDPAQCAVLAFEPVRCVAVVERARSIGSIPWPDVTAVRLERPNPRADSLGSSAGIATVVFRRLNEVETRIDVRCLFLRGPSLACGPGTVPPHPSGSPAP